MAYFRPPVLLDAVIAVVLTGLSVANLLVVQDRPDELVALLLVVLAVAPIAARQFAPLPVLLTIASALVAYALLGFGEWPSAALALAIALFTVGTLCSRRAAAIAYAATVVVFVVAGFRIVGATWPMVAQACMTFLCIWALGDSTRRWVHRSEQAAVLAERSVTAERTRIARELHDIVSHHMSVVALQTGLADYVLETDPVTARRAIANAGAAGREALHDMGRLLGALRVDEESAPPLRPQPGLGQIPGLVERTRSAGLEVDLQLQPGLETLPPAVELCVFRVVQEALTNVLKHAGPSSTAQVRIEHGDGVLTVEVTDDGAGNGARPANASGLGLRGMRERAALFGGVVQAGPRPDGGYLVRLRLPIGDWPDAAADPTVLEGSR